MFKRLLSITSVVLVALGFASCKGHMEQTTPNQTTPNASTTIGASTTTPSLSTSTGVTQTSGNPTTSVSTTTGVSTSTGNSTTVTTTAGANTTTSNTTTSVSTTTVVPTVTITSTTTTPVVTSKPTTTPTVTSTVIPTTTTGGTTTKPTSTTQVIPSTSTTTTGVVSDSGKIEGLVVYGRQESVHATWTNIAGYEYNVYYKTKAETSYTALDSILVRKENNTVTMDIVGLLANQEYDIRVVPVLAGKEVDADAALATVVTTEYDRSGYAHFNYTDGVGAYNDDGTLKDDAVVIYVTEQNKDNLFATEENKWLEDYAFNIPGNDWGNKQATGIGWYLNNTQYTKAERNSNGSINESKSSNTYSANGANLGLAEVNKDHPIVIRFIGEVTSPEGLTAYNSVNEGGTVGDNGHMARMKNYKNITIEGIGDDAIIKGWGFHFIATDTTVGGYSFEVRNLTFTEYPEDAVGMEGVQEGDVITAPVTNCWIHHNTFLPGYCANPAESDKAEGDGSCDFKRGWAYTMSYNYYEYCHKTNLVGSSDSSLQYDISFHHNVWYQCGSRIPLLRRANLHFYNNYIYGDTNDDAAELSYVSSLRASCYMYSENNYYDGCKQVFDVASSGVAKAYGNVYVSCFNEPAGVTEVSSREQKVSNSCKYGTTDYSSFDTNPTQFYYDAEAKQSDCYLTSAVEARTECITSAGSAYRTVLDKTSLSVSSISATAKEPQNYLSVSEAGFNVTLPTTKGDSVKDNIVYSNITGTSTGTIKFKGQGITFKINTTVEVSVTMTAKGYSYGDGYLIDSYGNVYLNKSGTVQLTPGTYAIVSYSKDKETTVSALSFIAVDTEEMSKQRVENAKKAIAAIPADLEYTSENVKLVQAALEAIRLLTDDELKQVDSAKAEAAKAELRDLGKVYVEEKIDAIGTVTAASGVAIQEADMAYEELMAFDDTIVVDNYDKLQQALRDFEGFAVQSCKDLIDAIGTVTLDSKNAIDLAQSAYDSLSETQKSQVTNYNTLKAAQERLASLEKQAAVKDLYDNVNVNDLASIQALVNAYNELTAAEQKEVNLDMNDVYVKYVIKLIDSIGEVTLADKEVVDAARATYDKLDASHQQEVTNYQTLVAAEETIKELLSQTQICTFEGKKPSNTFFKISGNYKDGLSVVYNGVTYTYGLKIETSTNITFTIETTMKLTLVGDKDEGAIVIDGVKDDVAYKFSQIDGGNAAVFTIVLEAGTHTITKDDSMNLVYMELSPVANN